MELGEWNMNGSHPIRCNRNKVMLINISCVCPHLKTVLTSTGAHNTCYEKVRKYQFSTHEHVLVQT